MDENLKNIYQKITKELIGEKVIKGNYQSAIIEYNYGKNVNKYIGLCDELEPIRDEEEQELDKKVLLKRFRKLYQYLERQLEHTTVDSILMRTLCRLLNPDTIDEKYKGIISKIKQNEFKNPITFEFLLNLKKAKGENEKMYYSEDILHNNSYTDEWFIESIREKTDDTNWTMGCLLEKTFFNVTKNELYINVFLKGLDTEKETINILGLFIENEEGIIKKNGRGVKTIH